MVSDTFKVTHKGERKSTVHSQGRKSSQDEQQIRLMIQKQVVQPRGKGTHRALNLLTVKVPDTEWTGLTAWGRKGDRLVGLQDGGVRLCPEIGVGRRGNDEPKGGGNGAGPETWAKRAGRRGAARPE